MANAVDRIETANEKAHLLADKLGTLLVRSFHALALFARQARSPSSRRLSASIAKHEMTALSPVT